MIRKNIKTSLIQCDRNLNNELILIVPDYEIKDIVESGGVMKVGFDKDDLLQIRGYVDDELIVYFFPYRKEILDLKKRFNLNHVKLGVSKGRVFKENEVEFIFEGLLKLI